MNQPTQHMKSLETNQIHMIFQRKAESIENKMNLARWKVDSRTRISQSVGIIFAILEANMIHMTNDFYPVPTIT